MDEIIRQEIYRRFEREYWWFIGRRKIISDQISRYTTGNNDNPRVLEIGCGTGGNIEMLSRFGKVYGTDISLEALRISMAEGKVLIADAVRQPFRGGTFSLIAALDVLEHLEWPDDSLSEAFKLLCEGGFIVITVPAFQFLFSPYADKGHKRRYLSAEVKGMVEEAGFEVRNITYFNFLLFPLMFVERMAERFIKDRDPVEVTFRDLPTLLNKAFTMIFGLEKTLLRFVKFPFGGSILCIAQKRKRV